MQKGLGGLGAGSMTDHRRLRQATVLLLGLAAGGCVGTGQIANLADAHHATASLESIDGPPPAVFHRLVASLKQEASGRQIELVPSSQAHYHLRGYLAANDGPGTTSIAWVLDIYDANERRAFRLSGEEKSAGQGWNAADDQLLGRIADASMQQFATFAAAAGALAGAAGAVPSPPRSGAFGWFDDWTPEASGIFRILPRQFRRDIAADASTSAAPDQVPLPRGRPATPDATRTSSFAFAPDEQ